MTILAALPVKPFGVAKARLGPALRDSVRARLSKAVAARTGAIAAAAGADVAVITADAGVARWARREGFGVIPEKQGKSSLNGAAETAISVAKSTGTAWAIIHADLIVVQPHDFSAVFGLASAGIVLAPSHDGGTNVIAGSGDSTIEFKYGQGSFARHLAACPEASVVSRPGLALDLDTPRDLERAMAMEHSAWLEDLMNG